MPPSSESLPRISKRRTARAVLRQYEGMLWTAVPWRHRLLAVYAYPTSTLRVLGDWFRQVTAMPGDRAYLPVRDMHLVVREVKPRSVTCEVASGMLVHYSPNWPDELPAGCQPAYETFPRRPFGRWR